MAANLGSSFIGTSNAFLAHKHDLEAIGTNAHEIPMVMAALAPDDVALKASQYRVLELWQQTYEGALRVHAAGHVWHNAISGAARRIGWLTGRASASTARILISPATNILTWLKTRGRDPREKLLIASDTLDVDQILGLHAYFGGTLAKGTAWRLPQRGGF